MMKKVTSFVLVFLIVLAGGCIETPDKNTSSETKSPTTTPMPEQELTPTSVSLSDRVYVEIDPRIELIAVIYRLSDVKWYREEVDPARLGVTPEVYEYLRDVDEYFGP